MKLRPQEQARQQIGLGIFVGVFSAVAMAAMALMSHKVLQTEPVVMVLLVQSIVGCVITGMVIGIRGGTKGFRTHRPGVHLVRDAMGLVGFLLLMYALSGLGAAETLLLSNMCPFWILVFGTVFLGRRSHWGVWVSATAAFAGLAIVLIHGRQDMIINPHMAAAVGNGVALAIISMLLHKMGATEPVERTTFYYSIVILIAALVGLVWFWKEPTMSMLGLMIGVGLAWTFRVLTYAQTNRLCPSHLAATLTYLSVIVSLLFEWWFYGQLLGPSALLGMALVIGGGICMAILVHRSNRGAPNGTRSPSTS